MSSPNLLKSLTATSMYPVPSEQPRNVYAKDKASATVIYLSWQSPPEHTIHGILRGYYIWYSIIRLGIYDETPVFPQDYRKKQLPAESKSDALTELESYATYDIRIAAFTSKGYGPIKALSSSKRDYSWYLTIWIFLRCLIYVFVKIYVDFAAHWVLWGELKRRTAIPLNV